MVDTVRQLCIKSFDITAENGDFWEAIQGKEYTTTEPVENYSDVTVFSKYWVEVPKENFILVENNSANKPDLRELLCRANKHYSNFPAHVKDRETAKLFKMLIDELDNKNIS